MTPRDEQRARRSRQLLLDGSSSVRRFALSRRSLLSWTTTSSPDAGPGIIATRDCASWRRIARADALASWRQRRCLASSHGISCVAGVEPMQRHGLSAALESATAVLIRPVAPLHHAVDRDVRGGRSLHGRRSLLGRTLLRPMRSVRQSGRIEGRPNRPSLYPPMTGSHTRRIGSRGHTHQPHARRST
jgi:hypothetical protein